MLSCFSYDLLFVTLWGVAQEAPLSMGFSRQEYWSGLPCPPPEDLPGPRIEPDEKLLLPAMNNTGILGLRRRGIQLGQ